MQLFFLFNAGPAGSFYDLACLILLIHVGHGLDFHVLGLLLLISMYSAFVQALSGRALPLMNETGCLQG